MRLARQDEVHLRSEVVVPKATIGRIIGKGGQNVSHVETSIMIINRGRAVIIVSLLFSVKLCGFFLS